MTPWPACCHLLLLALHLVDLLGSMCVQMTETIGCPQISLKLVGGRGDEGSKRQHLKCFLDTRSSLPDFSCPSFPSLKIKQTKPKHLQGPLLFLKEKNITNVLDNCRAMLKGTKLMFSQVIFLERCSFPKRLVILAKGCKSQRHCYQLLDIFKFNVWEMRPPHPISLYNPHPLFSAFSIFYLYTQVESLENKSQASNLQWVRKTIYDLLLWTQVIA